MSLIVFKDLMPCKAPGTCCDEWRSTRINSFTSRRLVRPRPMVRREATVRCPGCQSVRSSLGLWLRFLQPSIKRKEIKKEQSLKEKERTFGSVVAQASAFLFRFIVLGMPLLPWCKPGRNRAATDPLRFASLVSQHVKL